MISHISIKNFAIIKNTEIDFDRGLNIITGETGAGKSIVIRSYKPCSWKQSRFFLCEDGGRQGSDSAGGNCRRRRDDHHPRDLPDR